MIQKQKIDAQYIKLIGVTLMMTAACVSDSGNKRALSFADESVREIILEQFQFLSSGHLAEVIEWEHAIKQATESHSEQSLSVRYTYFRLLVVNKALQSLLEDSSGETTRGYNLEPYHLAYIEPDIKAECWSSTENRNKHSLITRAGPTA